LVFATVAEQGSFSRAATRLHLAQPSISDKIARLERQLGSSLFVRTNRGAALTTAGERLLPFAQRCITLCDDAVRAVRANDADSRFRVLMHSSYAPAIMPFVLDVLSPFALEISNNDAHSEHVVQAVADGAADVGFTIAVPHPHNITLERFYTDPVVCVASSDHPLAEASTLSIAALAGHALAVNIWGDGADSFMELLQAGPIRSTQVRAVSPGETAAALARLRGHIAVCTRSTVALDLADGRLVVLPVVDLPRWDVEVYLAYQTELEVSEPVLALCAAVAAVDGGPDSWLAHAHAADTAESGVDTVDDGFEFIAT
jgi:DNA-binding transcriptional LysR family regulator